MTDSVDEANIIVATWDTLQEKFSEFYERLNAIRQKKIDIDFIIFVEQKEIYQFSTVPNSQMYIVQSDVQFDGMPEFQNTLSLVINEQNDLQNYLMLSSAITNKQKDPARLTREEHGILPSGTKLLKKKGLIVQRSEEKIIKLEYSYSNNPSSSHSRQERNQYLQEKLCLDPKDTFGDRKKKIILLFAHYMSIDDVKSTLSNAIEVILVQQFFTGNVLEKYKISYERNRLEKNKDRFSMEIRSLLLKRYDDISDPFLNDLITQLQPVDKLERSFFYKSHADEIKRIMKSVEDHYDKQIGLQKGVTSVTQVM